jgi:Recombination endonuclease VII
MADRDRTRGRDARDSESVRKKRAKSAEKKGEAKNEKKRAAQRRYSAAYQAKLRARCAQDPQLREQLLAARREWYAANSTELGARRRARYAQDEAYREKVLAQNKAHKHVHWDVYKGRERLRYSLDEDYRKRTLAHNRGEAGRARRLKRYGLTLADFDAMLEAQNGLCAVCGVRPARTLNIDHCHETGDVRGLLCSGCNTGSGGFKDNPYLLRKAADFIDDAIARRRKRLIAAGLQSWTSPLV